MLSYMHRHEASWGGVGSCPPVAMYMLCRLQVLDMALHSLSCLLHSMWSPSRDALCAWERVCVN